MKTEDEARKDEAPVPASTGGEGETNRKVPADGDKASEARALLNHIAPNGLNYEEWLQVGMALKHEGCNVFDWEDWSKQDPDRYHDGECWRKWGSFNGSDRPITIATLVEFAKRQGYRPGQAANPSRAYDITETIPAPRYEYGPHEVPPRQQPAPPPVPKLVHEEYVEPEDLDEPGDDWNPISDLVTYLDAVFEADEHVGFVTPSWQKDDRWLPKKGVCGKTAGQLIEELQKEPNRDMTMVLGDWNPEAGAWIRFNPLDGEGVKDANVTAYRHALVESDKMDVGEQLARIKEMQLPCTAIVHSGGKSVHAIVRVDADTKEEYRQRVDYLYEVCERNGLPLDRSNRNPSRLSRMPGITRNGRKQFLVATNFGHKNWQEWHDWAEDVKDGLPEIEPPRPVADLQRPEPGDPSELILHRFLCRGYACLLVGPSGIGKSSFVMQVALTWSLGRSAFGMEPTRPLKVLLIQAENDDGDLAEMRDGVLAGLALNMTAEDRRQATDNVHVQTVTTVVGDKVAALLRRYGRQYDMVILDPLFAYIGADVMDARQATHWVREVIQPILVKFGIALVIVHHTNKPSSGGEKNNWQAGDFAYLGAGSAEFTNWPRAVLAIRSVGSDSVFELLAAKRGKRLRWRDADGETVTKKLIGHGESGICWRELNGAEAAAFVEDRKPASGSKQNNASFKQNLNRAREMVRTKAWRKGELKEAVTAELAVKANYYDRQLMKALKEDPEFGEATVHLSAGRPSAMPVHLFGPVDLVTEEAARREAEDEEKKATLAQQDLDLE